MINGRYCLFIDNIPNASELVLAVASTIGELKFMRWDKEMDTTSEIVVHALDAISPQVRAGLTVLFSIFALYFVERFGESLGKAVFYFLH